MKKIFLFCSLAFYSMSYADHPTCNPYPFLHDGFNMQAYSDCKNKFVDCHMSGGLPDKDCVKKIVNKTPSCNQLQQLSKVLETNPASISAEAHDQYIVIDQVFIADGQNNYYIISPQNCIVATNLDPRSLDDNLKKQYQSLDLVVTTSEQPVMSKQDGKTIFTDTLKVNKTCLACETLGYAKINFIFDPDGKFLEASLVEFKEGM